MRSSIATPVARDRLLPASSPAPLAYDFRISRGCQLARADTVRCCRRSRPSAAAALDAGRIVLRANADSWLMVKDRAGAVLLNRTLKAGETWPVPPRPDLLLTTGNAGGTEIVVDGAASRPGRQRRGPARPAARP